MIFDKLIFQKHLEEGEGVLFVAHKHWVAFLVPLLRILFFGFFLPGAVYYAGFRTNFSLLLLGIWVVLACIILLYDFIDWYSDVWLMTTMSIIIVEWHGIFSNTSQRVDYGDTEGVSFVIKGFWGTILRYGDVTLKVISGGNVTLKNATSPKKIELALMKYQGEFMSNQEMAHAGGLKEILSQLVAHHLRNKN